MWNETFVFQMNLAEIPRLQLEMFDEDLFVILYPTPCLSCTALYFTSLHCTALHCTVVYLYCILLGSRVVYCILLGCTVPYWVLCTVFYWVLRAGNLAEIPRLQLEMFDEDLFVSSKLSATSPIACRALYSTSLHCTAL